MQNLGLLLTQHWQKVEKEECCGVGGEVVKIKGACTYQISPGDWAIQDPLLEKLVGRPLETFDQRLKLLASGQVDLAEMQKKHDYST